MNQQQQNSAPAIEFRNVSVSFNDHEALTDISFQLRRGEMILLTGITGSGKSVLLRLAAGLLKPDAGQIFIFGKEIETLAEAELLAIRGGLMGMVFQEDSLFTGMTVYENADYRLEDRGWSGEAIEKAVAEILEFVGLAEEAEKLPEELSGGMKRRLELARALIGWPKIMLFDEPTNSLDPMAASKVLDLIIRSRDVNGISSLYVTKKMGEIPILASYSAAKNDTGEIIIEPASPDRRPQTRVIVLLKGRIAFLGTVEDFQSSNLPAIQELMAHDRDHENDPYFTDPWDKRRRPKEAIL